MNSYIIFLVLGLLAVVNLVSCHREICSITRFNNIWKDIIETETNCSEHCYLKVIRSSRSKEVSFRFISFYLRNLQNDPLLETLLGQFFHDSIRPQMNRLEPALGAVLDPLWLFPIGPLRVRKKMFKGQLTACNLHLHNLKVSYQSLPSQQK